MARMRENVCIQGFVRKGSYLEELGIDGTKVLELIFQKQVEVEFFKLNSSVFWLPLQRIL